MGTGGGANGVIRFNDDSGSNYNSHYLGGNGVSGPYAGFFQNGSYTGAYCWDATGPSTANSEYMFSASIIDILDYTNTTKYKTTRSYSSNEVNGSGGNVSILGGTWRSTAAINSITLIDAPGGAPMGSNTQFALYGIRG